MLFIEIGMGIVVFMTGVLIIGLIAGRPRSGGK